MADNTASKATATKAAPQQTKLAQPAENKGALTVSGFVNLVLTEPRLDEVTKSLPAHVPVDRFRRNFVTAISQNPRLAELDPGLVYREVAKAASFGLLLDPILGEGYIVIAWNGKTKREEPQLRIGYRGYIKLGRQSGELKKIYAREVRQKDKFRAQQGTDESIEHEIVEFGDRGAVVGYYAVVQLTNGETDFELMSQEDAYAIRDRSDGWKAFVEKKIKSTPWSTDPVEMSKKTVLRRLLKRVPMSPDLVNAIRHEDAADGVIDTTPPAPPRPGKPASAHDGLNRMTDALAGKTAKREAATDVVDEGGDLPSGEVDEPADDTVVESREDDASKPPLTDVHIPTMPDGAIKPWLAEKRWLPGWKWLYNQFVEVTPAVGAALVNHHADIVRAMAAHSDNNKAIVIEWLQRFGVDEAMLKNEGGGNGGK